MPSKEEIIRALRCAVTPQVCECKENCPYRVVEEAKKEYMIPPDLEIDGIGYWVGCDYDKVMLDAADMLEGKA